MNTPLSNSPVLSPASLTQSKHQASLIPRPLGRSGYENRIYLDSFEAFTPPGEGLGMSLVNCKRRKDLGMRLTHYMEFYCQVFYFLLSYLWYNTCSLAKQESNTVKEVRIAIEGSHHLLMISNRVCVQLLLLITLLYITHRCIGVVEEE